MARSIAAKVAGVFERLHGARFQIRRMRPVHTYDGVVAAVDDIGGGWGGRWRGLKDDHHFSATGR
ncbi:MAG TPA: M15 family metallopeptidase [Euzebyales bacterium]|nr:M15 family metallopeptidase [Euzebyales bacterium]